MTPKSPVAPPFYLIEQSSQHIFSHPALPHSRKNGRCTFEVVNVVVDRLYFPTSFFLLLCSWVVLSLFLNIFSTFIEFYHFSIASFTSFKITEAFNTLDTCQCTYLLTLLTIRPLLSCVITLIPQVLDVASQETSQLTLILPYFQCFH